MREPLDILVAGMDKLTRKSFYLYDAFSRAGIRCLLYSRDKTGLFSSIRDKVRTRTILVPKNLLWEILIFVRLLVCHRPRHVELYGTHIVAQLFYVVACLVLRIKLVVVCIGELYDWDSHRELRKLVDRFTYWAASLIVLTELYMEDTVRKHRLAPAEKLVFCHNRIPNGPPGSPERKEKVVLFLNTFKRWRRLELLLEAVPKVIEKFPEARFLLVGSTKGFNYLRTTHGYEDELAKISRDLGIQDHVTVLPFTDDPENFYAQVSVFVLPADLVYCNFSVLEAMERCVPAVISDVEGASLMVEDGVSGLVVKRSPQELADAIVKLLADESLRREMGLKARAKVLKDYEIKQSVALLRAAYTKHLKSWQTIPSKELA